jgi:hypothetical protein
MNMTQENERYYLRIKTAPHQQWQVLAGWTANSLADARWMAVMVIDSQTGEKISAA